jgi:hypothetical protein
MAILWVLNTNMILKLLFSSCFEDTGGSVHVQGVVISNYVLSHK